MDGASCRLSWARDTHRSAFRAEEREPAHQGPKRAGYGVPEGFEADHESGYYYSAETGYYYDAAKCLYYHPATGLWYSSDPITGKLSQYIDEKYLDPITGLPYEMNAEAAPAAAPLPVGNALATAAAAAAAAAAAGGGEPAVAEAKPLEGNRGKVVLGMGGGGGLAKGKKLGLAKPSLGLFKQAVADEPEEPAEPAEPAEARGAPPLRPGDAAPPIQRAGRPRPPPDLRADGAPPPQQQPPPPPRSRDGDGDVDWDNLVCLVCKRKLKSAAVLAKHVAESELHKQNVAARDAQRRPHDDGRTNGRGFSEAAPERRR